MLSRRLVALVLASALLPFLAGCAPNQTPRPVKPVPVSRKAAPQPTYTQVAKRFLTYLKKGKNKSSYKLLAESKIRAEGITPARWRRVVAGWQVRSFTAMGHVRNDGYGVVLANTSATAVGATDSASVTAVGIVLARDKKLGWRVLIVAPETVAFSKVRRMSLRKPEEGQFQIKYESVDAAGNRVLGAKNYFETQPPP